MAVSLAESKNNATEDYDPAVIDEFRKNSGILDSLLFDDAVSPTGGGGTLDYGYRRLKTQPTADTRAYGNEYTSANVTTQKHSITLAVMGGSFDIDRVLAKLGPAASSDVALNIEQKAKAASAKFTNEIINGDVASDANGFDGLDKALTGSDTEFRATVKTDWSNFSANETVHTALDDLDEWLSMLDGAPTAIVGNAKALARVRAAARRAGMYTLNPVDGLVGQNGRPIERETYGNIVFLDAGAKPGTNDPIIPVETRTLETVSETGITDLYAYRVGLNGFHGVSTVGGQLVQTWLPDFTTAGAVKKGEVELGPVGVALKATKAASVFRNIKVV